MVDLALNSLQTPGLWFRSQVRGSSSSDKTQVPFGGLMMPQSSWSYNLHPKSSPEQHWLPRQAQGLDAQTPGAPQCSPTVAHHILPLSTISLLSVWLNCHLCVIGTKGISLCGARKHHFLEIQLEWSPEGSIYSNPSQPVALAAAGLPHFIHRTEVVCTWSLSLMFSFRFENKVKLFSTFNYFLLKLP